MIQNRNERSESAIGLPTLDLTYDTASTSTSKIFLTDSNCNYLCFLLFQLKFIINATIKESVIVAKFGNWLTKILKILLINVN
jgi:hypothetical protein